MVVQRRKVDSDLLGPPQGRYPIIKDVDAEYVDPAGVRIGRADYARHLGRTRRTPACPHVDDDGPASDGRQAGQPNRRPGAQAVKGDRRQLVCGANRIRIHPWALRQACRGDRALLGGPVDRSARRLARPARAGGTPGYSADHHSEQGEPDPTRHALSTAGVSLTSLLAVFGSVGPRPYDGHSVAIGHAPQAGRREWQIRRPCQISRCDSIVHSDFGISDPTSCSTFTGSSELVQPKRRASRPKCVSTVIPGIPNAFPSTTFAVFRPTPGSVTRSLSRLGTSPPYRSHRSCPSLINDVVLAR